MKVSKYNFLWYNKHNKEYILYNTYTGAIELFPQKLGLILKNIFNNHQTYSSLLTQLSLNALCMRLYKNGFLIDNARDELKEIEFFYNKNKFGNNDTKCWEVAIAPTMACNFDCQYCYASLKHGAAMSKATQEILIKRMSDYIIENNIKYMNISWVGGEPLCHVEAMRKISSELYEICSSVGCKLSAALISNGSLLSSQLAEALSKPPFQINYLQITVDAYWHNKTRPFRTRKDASLPATLKGIKNAAKYFPRRVVMRVNVPYDCDISEKQLIDFIINLLQQHDLSDKINFYLAPVQPATEESRLNVKTKWPADKFAVFKANVTQAVMAAQNKAYIPYIPQRRVVPCGYEFRDNICIDSLGNIYKCWHHLGVNDKIIGSIDKPLNFQNYFDSPAYNAWLSWNPMKTRCAKCKMLPVCMGFCYDLAFELGGNDLSRCLSSKFIIKEDCKRYVEEVIKQRKLMV